MWMEKHYPPLKNHITPEWPRVLLEPHCLTVWLEDGRSASCALTDADYSAWFMTLQPRWDDDKHLDHELDDLVEWIKAGSSS